MIKEKLTVVFPVYKDNEVLERALKALADQTFKDFRVVIMDDASPARYESLVEKYEDRLNIRIERNPKNLGGMPNMWQSIQYKTDTPYLLSHHADDFIKNDYLERAIEILENDANISFVVTDPEWVNVKHRYVNISIGKTEFDTFSAAEFAFNVLHFAPYMFGSVVYRTSHRTTDWKHDYYDGFCDRYFLGTILRQHSSKGCFLHGKGIIERDHSQDLEDKRGENATDDNFIRLLAFYRELMIVKFSKEQVSKIITNNALYYYSTFPARKSFVAFYKKQRMYGLIKISDIRLLGLYGIITTPIPNSLKVKFIPRFKKLLGVLT